MVCTCDNKVALKIDTSDKPELLKTEFELLKKLHGHPNIVKVFNFSEKGDLTIHNNSKVFSQNATLEMELCEHGDLFDLV